MIFAEFTHYQFLHSIIFVGLHFISLLVYIVTRTEDFWRVSLNIKNCYLKTKFHRTVSFFIVPSNIKQIQANWFSSISREISRKSMVFRWFKEEQETQCVVTIARICSILASLWKFQNFWRPMYKPVEHLWWSFHCKNSKPLSIFTKNATS